ncbi:Integral membrane protein SED5 [Tieghemiomyces parasiticus]|uniref:Integral membrane protein SED5 n=1 Tax=Tieghemiomyces parasiticus TaxID=78921 RepID=A0A9W8DYK5_9FUNG|nr:Integral membrane protein SED5 [Tieghemiomyces parasiticus]
MGPLDTGDVIIEMAVLPPKCDLGGRERVDQHAWPVDHVVDGTTVALDPDLLVDLVDEINEKFGQICNDMKYLASLHKKHLLPGFDDRREEEEAIEDMTDSITKKFRECQELVRHIVSAESDGQDAAVGRNIRTSMASKLQTLSTDFRKSQSIYLDKMRSLRSRNQNLFSVDASSTVDASQERSFNFDLTDEQIATMKDNDTTITEREREIEEIAKSISTVAEIFKEMQTMVIDQGTLLDRIDYNVEQVVVHVVKANEELDEGNRIQKKGTSQKFVIILLVIIAILIVTLILKHVRRK